MKFSYGFPGILCEVVAVPLEFEVRPREEAKTVRRIIITWIKAWSSSVCTFNAVNMAVVEPSSPMKGLVSTADKRFTKV